MKFAAALILVALLPIVGLASYHLKSAPSPTMIESIKGHLKTDGEQNQEQWLYVVTEGELRGQESDAVVISQLDPAELEEYPGKYIVRTCGFYTTSGNPKELFDAEMVGYCTQRVVSKSDVREYAKTLNGAHETS